MDHGKNFRACSNHKQFPKSLDRRGPIKNTKSNRAVCTSLVWTVENQTVLLAIQQTVLTVLTEDRMTSKWRGVDRDIWWLRMILFSQRNQHEKKDWQTKNWCCPVLMSDKISDNISGKRKKSRNKVWLPSLGHQFYFSFSKSKDDPWPLSVSPGKNPERGTCTGRSRTIISIEFVAWIFPVAV